MKIDFQKGGGLVPVIVRDSRSGAVLMLGYMNAEALEATRRDGLVTFYSRSKQRLWRKGETSGNFLDLVSIAADCDSDALLVTATPRGPVCHTGSLSCFGPGATGDFLVALGDIIEDRKRRPSGGSYTSDLFASGIKRIAQKVGEEGLEVALEAQGDDIEALKGEAADLLFHLMVLLSAKGMSLADVTDTLRKRHESA